MPDNGTNAAAVDWTPQEKFVWERVAAGKIADFNTADGYGGDLDPKKPEGWPDNRVLRSAFLETILLEELYRRNLSRRGVTISGARFIETIDLEGAELQHLLVLFASLIEKDANLRRVKSKYPIGLSHSKIVGTLQTNGLDLDASLLMRDGEFAEVDLSSTRIGGQLALEGSKITGKLNMNGLRVGRDLVMRNKAEFVDIDLTGAHIGGTLSLNASRVAGKLDMNGMRVERSLFMRGKAEFAEVDLTGAYIGEQLSLIDSKVTGKLNCDSVDVGETVFLCRGATFSDPINLMFAKIGQNLELAEGNFGKQVDMTGARIVGELRLGSARHSPAVWQPDAALILRNVSIDTIQDLSDAWPARIELNGFNYQSLGGLHATQKDSMLDRPIGWFKAWLGKQERYAAQPYERLASCLRNNGKSEMATAIRFAGCERERKEASGWWRKIWLTVFKYSVGYGYRPWRALGWAVVFVLLGAAVLHISGEGLRNNMPYGLAYSFDMLLPLVKLRESHYKIDLLGWARYYFYAHKIMGYLLASFLIAGLSGLRAGSISRE
jgi:uncharacterized protein YjbI with pentapeptide repeats